jgi:uncharacterized cupredoxin-like copper-binding protein
MSKKISFTLLLAIFLTACASPSQATGTEITVDATDFAYNPSSITVPSGEPVTITLNNSGNVEHDFVVEKINVKDVVASDTGPAEHHQMSGMPDYDLHFFAKSGDSATLQFTALEPGTYEIFCSIQGHKEAGTIGNLIVSDQD